MPENGKIFLQFLSGFFIKIFFGNFIDQILSLFSILLTVLIDKCFKSLNSCTWSGEFFRTRFILNFCRIISLCQIANSEESCIFDCVGRSLKQIAHFFRRIKPATTNCQKWRRTTKRRRWWWSTRQWRRSSTICRSFCAPASSPSFKTRSLEDSRLEVKKCPNKLYQNIYNNKMDLQAEQLITWNFLSRSKLPFAKKIRFVCLFFWEILLLIDWLAY